MDLQQPPGVTGNLSEAQGTRFAYLSSGGSRAAPRRDLQAQPHT